MTGFVKSELGGISKIGRETLNSMLKLSGAEVSINNLPAGVSVPFVHAHKENEEVYIVLSGNGVIYLNGDEVEITEGSVLKVEPSVARCIKAATDSALSFICIQSKANSLTQFTETDGFPVEVKPSWF
nr:cupin domain-containing protein [uncultured Tolumonas sp.]